MQEAHRIVQPTSIRYLLNTNYWTARGGGFVRRIDGELKKKIKNLYFLVIGKTGTRESLILRTVILRVLVVVWL